MAILIGDQDNEFSVKGEINLENSKVLKQYVEAQFRKFTKVIMNIDQVSKIDRNGISELRAMYHHSLRNGVVLMITGTGCKEIYDDFLMSA